METKTCDFCDKEQVGIPNPEQSAVVISYYLTETHTNDNTGSVDMCNDCRAKIRAKRMEI